MELWGGKKGNILRVHFVPGSIPDSSFHFLISFTLPGSHYSSYQFRVVNKDTRNSLSCPTWQSEGGRAEPCLNVPGNQP